MGREKGRSYGPLSYGRAKEDPVELYHVGLLNLGNSCFFNTIVQSLSVARPLSAAISAPPPSSPALLALASTTATSSPDAASLPSPLPLTQAFITLLARLSPEAPETNDSGKPQTRPKAFNPKGLLKELSLKHEEYADATQQDAHELLRHLMDGVLMEEFDMIKKLAPPAPPPLGRRRMTIVKASSKPAPPQVTLSRASTTTNETTNDEESDASSSEDSSSSSDSEAEVVVNGKGKAMRPFIDTVFGGRLCSVVVCDECKHVSLTHEDFLDLSLSLKDDTTSRVRRRDRIRKTLQAGFFSSKKTAEASKTLASPQLPTAPLRPIISLSEAEASLSEAENDSLTDSERLANVSRLSRRKSLDPASLREARKPFWSVGGGAPHSRDPSPSGGSGLSRALSIMTGSSVPSARPSRPRVKPRIPKPTAEQSAYIRRVLAEVPGPSPSPLPLQLRWAQPGVPSTVPATPVNVSPATQSLAQLQLQSTVDQTLTDLYECLRGFTSVEVLEGENSFACRNCWKLMNPELVSHRRAQRERRKYEKTRRRAAGTSDGGSRERNGAEGFKATGEHFLPVSPAVHVAPPLVTSPSLLPVALPSVVSSSSHSGPSLSSLATTGTSGNLTDDEGGNSTDVLSHDGDAEDGDITDASIDSPFASRRGSLAKLPLTKENVLALTPDALHTLYPTAPSSIATTSKASDRGASVAFAPSLTGASLSTRPSFPNLVTPPKAARHILRKAHKRYLISALDLPPVCVIHLKRFQNTSKATLFGTPFMNLKKREDFVSFSEEIDLTPFLAPLQSPPRPSHAGADRGRSGKEEIGHSHLWSPRPPVQSDFVVGTARYRLFAVVVHSGTLAAGHYVSYNLTDRYTELGKGVAGEEPKEKGARRWIYASDDEVRVCTKEEVMQSKAYMLFYERVGSAVVKSRI